MYFTETSSAAPETVWAAIEALATVATAGIAAWTLLALKADSHDRTRPLMTAELKPEVLTSTCEILVSNRGQSAARNVSVIFDPALPVLAGTAAHGLTTPYLQRRYAEPIGTVAPGTVLHNVYQDGETSREPVPDVFTVRFNYADERGRVYEDAYRLSLETLKGMTTATPSGDSHEKLLKRAAKALEAIARGNGRA